tara:strand:+ start:991 stop:1356 length:366 start_codon:yes stop_codon:yes gene_type:complete
MPLFASEVPVDALTRIIRAKMHLKVARGMKIRAISDFSVLLEDLEEWVWADCCLLQSFARQELSFDVYAASSDTLPGVAALVTVHPRAALPSALAWLLNVMLAVCTIFWLSTVWGIQYPVA